MSDKEDDDSSTENDQVQELFTTLALRVHAANLPRHGVRQALPDTYAVVTSAIGRKSQSGPQASKGNDHVIRKIEWGRTEVVRKESHPQWTRTFELDYEYGSECYFLVEVRRIVNKKIESLGNAVCEVSDILGSKNHTKVKRLPKGGVVFCRIEAIREENTECIFRFRFAAKGLILGHRKLKSLSPFSHAPDTIVQISKRHPNAARLTWVTVYRSAPVENSFDPVWDIGEIDLESVCNANFDQPLRIAVLMSRKNARNVLIGECETTLRMILNTQADSTSALKDDSFHGFRLQRSMEKTKRVGFLQIQMAQVIDIVADKQLVIPLDNHMISRSTSSNTNTDTHDSHSVHTHTSTNSTSRHQPLVQMEWLPNWILHAEKVILQDLAAAPSHLPPSQTLSYHALCGMIRAFGHYQMWCQHRVNTKLIPKTNLPVLGRGLLGGSHRRPYQDPLQIASTFRRLQTTPARTIMIREWIQMAFRKGGDEKRLLFQVQSMLSPLLAASVLDLETPMAESMLFMESLWRECWAEMTTWEDQDFFAGLQWLTHALDLFLWGLSCHMPRKAKSNTERWYNPMDQLTSSKELAVRWLLQLVELAAFLSQNAASSMGGAPGNGMEASMAKGLTQWLSWVAGECVPRLFAVLPSYQISLEPILWQVLHVLEQLVADQDYRQRQGTHTAAASLDKSPSFDNFLDTVAILRLATLVLSDPILVDVQVLLQILQLVTSVSAASLSITEQAILRGVASILVRSQGCQEDCTGLLDTLKQLSASNTAPAKRKTIDQTTGIVNMIQFLDESIADVNNFVGFLTKKNSLVGTHCTAMQQTGSLLVGIGLLLDNSKVQTFSYAFLRNLLDVYPHLGISLLPALVDSINAACLVGDGAGLQEQLDFLCTSMVKDPQCAREIWSLLGVELMKPTTPVVIRSTILRCFPKLCSSNKRLYKRVIDVMGQNLANNPHNWEIRLAVAATIADLAKEDRIRDVTDVIGWIQSFISDTGFIRSASNLDQERTHGNAALVHFAILALHYLLVAQELDFNLVIVVLNKRLCNVHDMKEIIMLPPLVLENLMLLLGDGECEEDDEEEEEDQPLKPVGVSKQVTKSVETLIGMALKPKLDPRSSQRDVMARGTLLRCRRNIYDSLSRYSMDALGIDEMGIQAAVAQTEAEEETSGLPPSGEKYVAVRQIVTDGIELVRSGMYIMSPPVDGSEYSTDDVEASDVSGSLTKLLSSLLKYEEEVLGSTLWQKRGRNVKTHPKGRKFPQDQALVHSTLLEALPSPANVQKVYNDGRSPAAALANLLCFEGKPLSMLSDLASDIGGEKSDSIVRAFMIQGWLNAARSTLMELVVSLSSSEGLENVLMDIREWRFRLDSPDNMYMALACLALLIPEILGPYGDHSPYINEICEEVWNGYNDEEFEDSEVALLCIGFVGVCSVRSRFNEQLDDVVESLERSVSGYGGRATFGAYYSMAVVAQACADLVEHKKGRKGEGSDDGGLIRRIVSFLINELAQCISGTQTTISNLIASIQEGEISAEVIDDLTALSKHPLKIAKAKRATAKSLFISLALCIPSLASVNPDLLLGTYCLLEAIPWGYGKGFAVASVLQACKRSGLFKPREIEKIYAKHAKIFEEGMDKGVAGLDDIFYAVTATMSKAIPYSIRRFLVGNRTLFDEDGRAVSLLAAVVSLSSLPCLGSGTSSFTTGMQLSNKATNEDINGVVTVIMEAVGNGEATVYKQMGVILMGFLASMNNFVDTGDASKHSHSSTKETAQLIHSNLPRAHEGTVLEVVMVELSRLVSLSGNANEAEMTLLSKLLESLQVLSLPGHFASTLEQLFRTTDDIKTACTGLLISQIRGRPRAVFDGRDYVELALKMSKMPVTTIKSIMGPGEASIVFIKALVDLVPKFSTDSAIEVVENFWRLCSNQIGNIPRMSVAFLMAMKSLLRASRDAKSFMISPKTLNGVQNFLVTRVFAGIRDAPWSTITKAPSGEELSIVEAYASCLVEIPITTLTDAEFFAVKELDGFIGEALRYRCVMVLVQHGYFTTPARASSEIALAIGWFSRQLVSSDEDIFSSTLLQLASSIADATSVEKSEKRSDLLLTLLDNLMLTGPSASFVGLQMLGILVCKWTNGVGSDGDLSLACLVSTQMERWNELSPPTLQQVFKVIVHDLPFNLAAYAKAEKITGVIFNRLWRVYGKWVDQGAEQETIDCVRKALVCCRSVEVDVDDFASLATSMLF